MINILKSKINGRVRLSDIHPISRNEFFVACDICEKIKKCVEDRDDYIQRHNLDPEIAYPSANWGKDGGYHIGDEHTGNNACHIYS